MASQSLFKWRHFQPEIILLNVRWYCRYSLSYRDLEEMMAERGVEVDQSTINRACVEVCPRVGQTDKSAMTIKPQKILILAANPKQTVRLRLDEELRDIEEGLQRAQNRDNFELRSKWAVRPRDIRRAILDYRPNIIHFSGHGAREQGLAFEDEAGFEQLVTGEALAGFFGQFSNQVECVLLNACYSQVQADAIVQHINYVICMNDLIEDKAAIEFVVGFYDALLAYNPKYDSGSPPIEFAFNIAQSGIAVAGVSGESIPVLKKKINLTPHYLPLSNLTNVPELPPHFLPRPEELALLKQKVFSLTKQPVAITGKSRRVGVQGMGGMGKTVLATALARDEEVRKAFPDGVFWVTLGQTPQILTWQSYIAQALGDKQAAFTEIGLAKARLRELFTDKACLLVLDDIWRLDDATAFDVLGKRCQMLVTTRNAAIVTGLGGEEYQLAVLDAQQALALLADWANQQEIMYPTEQNNVALQVVRECGCLPLALAMVGAMMRSKPLNRWQNILEKLRSADLEKIKQQFPNYPYPNLLKAIQVSVDDMSENYQQRYLDFAVFPEDTPIPEAVLQIFWQPLGLDEFDTQDVIDELVNKSLALRDETGNLRLHDLQFDYVRKQHTTLVTKSEGMGCLHTRLLNAYSEKYPSGWHSLENDGYILQNLAYHLLAGGSPRELQQLLCDFRWLQAKLENININALLADYDFLPSDENLQLIQGALRLSAHILNQDKQQLPGQLLGRLLGFEREGIQALLTQAQQYETPCLLPQTASLAPPGGSLVRILEGHSDRVNALVLTLDGQYVISGSFDNTLKVWDWQTGQEVRTLFGHTDSVGAVALTPDGKYVISGSFDNTLKVWDWQTGQEVRTLFGHTDSVGAVVLTPDGKCVISGSGDNTLKVWDWQTGQEVRTLFGHTDSVYSIALTPDGKYVISGSGDNTLKVWDWQTGQEVRTLFGHTDSVDAVVLTPDGKYVISGSGDNTLKVWDWQTGQEVRTLVGHSHEVYSLALTPNGKYLISGSRDKTLKVWNWQIGEVIASFVGDGSILCCAITPDGVRVAAGEASGRVYFLRLQGTTE